MSYPALDKDPKSFSTNPFDDDFSTPSSLPAPVIKHSKQNSSISLKIVFLAGGFFLSSAFFTGLLVMNAYFIQFSPIFYGVGGVVIFLSLTLLIIASVKCVINSVKKSHSPTI